MWNGKTFPLSPTSEQNIKAVLLKTQAKSDYTNSICFTENVKANSKTCAATNKIIAIEMDFTMEKKGFSHHSA